MTQAGRRDGNDPLIINKGPGEMNRMRDDGFNHLLDLIIVTLEHCNQIAAEVAQIR